MHAWAASHVVGTTSITVQASTTRLDLVCALSPRAARRSFPLFSRKRQVVRVSLFVFFSLPQQLSSLRKLKVLNLSRNAFTGGLHKWVGWLGECSTLKLNHNKVASPVRCSANHSVFRAGSEPTDPPFPARLPFGPFCLPLLAHTHAQSRARRVRSHPVTMAWIVSTHEALPPPALLPLLLLFF